MKKIVSLTLTILMVFGLIVPIHATGGTVTLTTKLLDESDDILYVGEKFEVTVSLSGFPELLQGCSFQNLEYDSSAVKLVSGEWLYSGIALPDFNAAEGTGAYGAVQSFNVNGDAFKFTFEAVEVANKVDIALEFSVQDVSANVTTILKENITPASVKVTGKDFESEIPDTAITLGISGTREYNGEARTLEVMNLKDPGVEVTKDISITRTVGEVTETVDEIKNVGVYDIVAILSATGYNPHTIKVEDYEITPATLTVSGLEAQDKVYNGTDVATVVKGEGYAVSGLKGTDTVTDAIPDTLNGTFASANADENAQAVTIDEDAVAAALTGDCLSNYNIVVEDVAPATISKAKIIVTPDSKTKMTTQDDPAFTFNYRVDGAKLEVNELYGTDTLTGLLTREDAGNKVEGTYKIIDNGLTAGDNYTIEIKDAYLTIINKKYTEIKVSDITNNANELSYIEGEEFKTDKTSFTVKAKYTNEANKEVWEEIDKSMLLFNGENPYEFAEIDDGDPVTVPVVVSMSVGETELKDETNVINVAVKNKSIASIAVNATGATTTFNEAGTFTSEGLVVTATYDNGKSEAITNYTVTPPDGMIVDDKLVASATPYEVTVTSANGKTDTYEVKVLAKAINRIEITKNPTTMSYVVGQTFDKNGMTVVAYYDNYDGEQPITVTDYDVDTTELNVAGNVTITVSYEGKTATFTVAVAEKAVDKIAVKEGSKPTKTEYKENEPFAPEGMTILVTWNDDPLKPDYVTTFEGFDFEPKKLTPATETITITYGGKQTTYSLKDNGIVVNPRVLESLEITKWSNTCVNGDSIADAVLAVTAKYDNDEAEAFSGYTVSPASFVLTNSAVAEKVTVTVSYNGITSEAVEVTVVPCEAVNTITGVRYASLAKALAAAVDGDTVEVQLGTEIAEDVEITADVTLDLNGKTVTTAADASINTGDYILTVDNTDGSADVVLTINDTEETISAGETAEFNANDDESHDFEIMFDMMRTYHENFVFDITVKQPKNGTIKGKTIARIGETRTYTFVADEGYVLADVILDGESQGAVEKLVLNKINEDHEITAVFEKID